MNQEESTKKVIFELVQYGVINPLHQHLVKQYLDQIYSIGFNNGISHHNVKQRKPILMINKIGDIVREFESINAASRITEIDNRNIKRSIDGKRPSAGGYYWKYKK